MAPHSSILAWRIPWTEEPGRLQSMGSLRVGHDWATALSLLTFTHWRRKWQPTPVFLPGESQGRRSLAGCCLWGRTESGTTEATQQQRQQWLWSSGNFCCWVLPSSALHGRSTAEASRRYHGPTVHCPHSSEPVLLPTPRAAGLRASKYHSERHPYIQSWHFLVISQILKLNWSNILAWRIPWTEEPGRLLSKGSQESDRT